MDPLKGKGGCLFVNVWGLQSDAVLPAAVGRVLVGSCDSGVSGGSFVFVWCLCGGTVLIGVFCQFFMKTVFHGF